ncbi:protein Efr3p [[Candida] jaroonii]|uniref:Protein Efr3p n=1 Tax=[Candida] jaroonii TaxID=467808 RepID=A0ACA9Y1U4_9ASCO|nr:protein Efr3p [[Candida] jaroonii]
MFLSKHQKLILQCYPPGKGIEKKPNSSELSYLLYYASTRRVKLEKVIKFLYKKTVGDANRNKFGNLEVTLIIVSSLIEKCTDNLNVFADEALSIMNLCLKNNDLSLAKTVLNTYGTLCKNLNSDLFVGDKEFVKNFSNFSNKLFDFGTNNSKTPSPNQLEWKMISLISCRYISHCISYDSELCRRFLSRAIPLLIETYHEYQPNDKEISHIRTNSAVNGDEEAIKLTKVSSAKTAIAHQKADEDFENDIVDKQDVHEETVSCLKAYFNTSLISQISEATMQVVKYNYNHPKSGIDWSNKFLQLCTSWIPVQLRFVVLTTLVGNLKNLSSDKSQIDYQKHVAKFVLGLVSSNVNMIGLSISDFIQNILDLQHYLYTKQFDSLSSDNLNELSNIYSNAIVKLSTHIYYFDQVPDSINEIFIKIDSTLQSEDSSPSANLFKFISTLLNDVSGIFQDLRNKPSSINRNHVGLHHWEISLPLIAQKKLTNLYKKLSQEEVDSIQSKYLELFEFFLDYELEDDNEDINEIKGSENIKSNSSINASASSLKGDPIDKDNLLNANYDNLITNQNNFISNYLVFLDKYLTNNESINFQITEKLLIISRLLIDKFGINFLSNFTPFYFHWQLQNIDGPSKDTVLRDTFNDTCLKNILDSLDSQYPELSEHMSKCPLVDKLSYNIDYKISNGIWSTELSPIEKLNRDSNINIIEKKDFQEFVSGHKLLSTWVNVDKPLVLSVVPDDLSKELASELPHVNGNGTSNGYSNGISNGHHESNGSINGDHLTENSSKGIEDYKPTLGLGNTADIISIHSGLRNTSNGIHHSNTINSINNNLGVGPNSSYNTTNSWTEYNGSVYTDNKSKHLKVSELKEMLSDHNLKPPTIGDNQVTPGSVLSKQMVTHDMGSILDDLDSGDDESIIV